jgi:hypothetical protein
VAAGGVAAAAGGVVVAAGGFVIPGGVVAAGFGGEAAGSAADNNIAGSNASARGSVSRSGQWTFIDYSA